jgi:FMN phosphatase YigB (HAD superfamily)
MPAMTAPVAWIFDLDNTLHNASPHIFPHINRAMNAYLQQHLQLDEQRPVSCGATTGSAMARRCSA